MSQARKQRYEGTSLALLAVLFIALTVVIGVLFRGARLDLTENELYSVSDGTENILESIEEPINLYLYFSETAAEDIPTLKTYATRVRELLEEFEAESDGMLQLQVIDPLPFSEAEDEASQRGLQAIPAGPGGDNVFFGLAGTNAVGDQESIPFFDPSKEAFLEYDLAKMIHSLSQTDKPVIGIMSSLPINRGFDPATRQMREPWVVTQQIEQLFEVKNVPVTSESIPEDVDVLMLVHPKDLASTTRYAIDQFVMRGGKLAVFVDPHAELDQPADAQSNPQAAMFASRSSDLPTLLKAWGVAYDPGKVILDAEYGLQVSGPGRRPVRHIGILSLPEEAMNGDDPTLAQLSSINLSHAGHLAKDADGETEFEPLLTSSQLSQPVAVDRVKFVPDPSSLLDGFAPTDEDYVFAARVSGEIKSAFPDGPPGSEDEAEAGDGEVESEHLGESQGPVNIVVVADTDILADRLWVQVQNFFGQQLLSTFANNGDFAINLLDNLTGSSDLISIRGRATSRRPFTRVQEIERQAEERFRATEQQLEQELQETERKLSELQQGRNQEGGGALILSEEQQAELERFRQERISIRKQLREVQRNLRQEKEDLGVTLKLLNILLVPALLIVLALGIYWRRVKRQREA